MEEITVYDKSKVYLKEVKPLLDQIETVCVREHMPFAFTCAVKNTEKKTFYERAGEIAKMANVVLKDDYLTSVAIAMQGGRFTRENDDGLSEAVQSMNEQEEAFRTLADNNDEDDEDDEEATELSLDDCIESAGLDF